MPHKCIQVSEEGFLGSTNTKAGKVLITAAVVFVAYPTERISVAQRLFFGGSGHRAGAHTRPAWPKIPLAPLASPLASGARQSPLEGSKSLGGWPLEAGGNLQPPRYTRPDPYHSKHSRPKCDPTTGEAQCY